MPKSMTSSARTSDLRALLDTVVFIFAIKSPERLSKRAAAVISNTANIREMSSVSLTEIAIKVSLGKLNISAENVRLAMQDMDIRILPFTAEHAFRLFDVPAHHSDP